MLLLIEVADTSLAYDRDVKLPRYALAGIPEVWLVDLNARRLLVHQGPEAGRWRRRQAIADLGAVQVPVADGQPICVDLSGLF